MGESHHGAANMKIEEDTNGNGVGKEKKSSRGDIVFCIRNFPKETRKRVRHYAIEAEKSIWEVVDAAVNEYLDKKSRNGGGEK